MNESKVTWARPIGALIIFGTTLGLCAASLPVPLWAEVVAPLVVLTWYVDRTLWKFYTSKAK